MAGTADRIIKNTGWLYAKMAVTMFVSFYTTRLILNGLGVTDFGIYNIVGGAISMLGFLNSTMATATQRFMSYAEGQGSPDRKRAIFNVSLTLHLVLGLIVAVMLTLAGFVFFDGVLNIPPSRHHAALAVYGCLVASTFLTIINVPYDAVMNSHENMRYYALVGVLESLMKLAVAFACVRATADKLIVYAVLMACIPAVTLTIMKVYCHRHYPECVIGVRRYYDANISKEMLHFAGWNFWGSTSSLIGNYGNGIVMNHFYGATLNAAMGIAGQLNGQLHVFSNNMLKALNPAIMKSEGAGDRQKMLALATSGCKSSFALFAVLAIPFIIEMPFFLQVWLQHVPEWAVLFTQLQLVRTLIEMLAISYGSAIVAEGHIARYEVWTSILYLVPVTLLYILFSLGYSPVTMYALNISVFGILLACIRVYFVHRNCGMPYRFFLTRLLLPLAASFVLSFAVTWFADRMMPAGWMRFLIVLALGMVSYAVFFWFLSMDGEERGQMRDLYKKIRLRKLTKPTEV